MFSTPSSLLKPYGLITDTSEIQISKGAFLTLLKRKVPSQPRTQSTSFSRSFKKIGKRLSSIKPVALFKEQNSPQKLQLVKGGERFVFKCYQDRRMVGGQGPLCQTRKDWDQQSTERDIQSALDRMRFCLCQAIFEQGLL